MLQLFGVPDGTECTHQVCSKAGLESILKALELKESKGLQVLEIFIDKMDFP